MTLFTHFLCYTNDISVFDKTLLVLWFFFSPTEAINPVDHEYLQCQWSGKTGDLVLTAVGKDLSNMEWRLRLRSFNWCPGRGVVKTKKSEGTSCDFNPFLSRVQPVHFCHCIFSFILNIPKLSCHLSHWINPSNTEIFPLLVLLTLLGSWIAEISSLSSHRSILNSSNWNRFSYWLIFARLISGNGSYSQNF